MKYHNDGNQKSHVTGIEMEALLRRKHAALRRSDEGKEWLHCGRSASGSCSCVRKEDISREYSDEIGRDRLRCVQYKDFNRKHGCTFHGTRRTWCRAIVRRRCNNGRLAGGKPCVGVQKACTQLTHHDGDDDQQRGNPVYDPLFHDTSIPQTGPDPKPFKKM